jgi:hypothetical protein
VPVENQNSPENQASGFPFWVVGIVGGLLLVAVMIVLSRRVRHRKPKTGGVGDAVTMSSNPLYGQFAEAVDGPQARGAIGEARFGDEAYAEVGGSQGRAVPNPAYQDLSGNRGSGIANPLYDDAGAPIMDGLYQDLEPTRERFDSSVTSEPTYFDPTLSTVHNSRPSLGRPVPGGEYFDPRAPERGAGVLKNPTYATAGTGEICEDDGYLDVAEDPAGFGEGPTVASPLQTFPLTYLDPPHGGEEEMYADASVLQS